MQTSAVTKVLSTNLGRNWLGEAWTLGPRRPGRLQWFWKWIKLNQKTRLTPHFEIKIIRMKMQIFTEKDEIEIFGIGWTEMAIEWFFSILPFRLEVENGGKCRTFSRVGHVENAMPRSTALRYRPFAVFYHRAALLLQRLLNLNRFRSDFSKSVVWKLKIRS